MLKLQLTISPEKIPPLRTDIAILELIHERWPYFSRAQLRRWFEAERIKINQRKIPRSELLAPGTYEVVVENWSEDEMSGPRARASTQGCFLPIIFEDNNLLVLNKSSGTPSIPHNPDETETAVGAALALHPELANTGRGGLEPAILHRLDTGTSGLLVFAKNTRTFERLKNDWSSGKIIKQYRALVRPSSKLTTPPEALHAMTITTPLAHAPKSTKRMVACKGHYEKLPDQLEAETKILEVRTIRPNYLDLTITIRTGVMHQIRCHLSHLEWPIQGDEIYRGTPSKRLWLHAWRLVIPKEDSGAIELEAPLPESWP
jgi:23S rRNA pseudouridine1911/1915/1917 synthase